MRPIKRSVIPPDERGGQIQPRDQDDVHGLPEGPGHQDDDVIDGTLTRNPKSMRDLIV